MAFYDSAGDGQRFDYVGIDGTLSEPFYVFEFMRLFVENINKSFADDLPFFFRVGHTRQFAVEFLAGIYADDIR